MQLSSVLSQYTLVRKIGSGAAYQLDRTVRLFGECLGRPATTDDLGDESVSAWVVWMQGMGYAGETIFNHRSRLLAVWKFASRRGMTPPPCEVRPVNRPDPMPVAWTKDEVSKLLAACDQIRDVVRGVPMDRYLAVLVEVAYRTGLRRSDLWGLSRKLITLDATCATLRVRQRKTNSGLYPQIPLSLAMRVLALPGEYPLAWPCVPRTFYDVWSRLLRAAGLQSGALQKLRKTGATLVAADNDMQAAAEFLGHKTPGMVRWYVDRTIAPPKRYQPPELGG